MDVPQFRKGNIADIRARKAPAETKGVHQSWRNQSVGSHQSGEEAKRSQLEGAEGQGQNQVRAAELS